MFRTHIRNGCQLIAIDPEGELEGMTRRYKGDFIDLGKGGEFGMINPLEVVIDADEDEVKTSDISYNFASTEEEIEEALEQETENEKYRPRFITSNAITLTDKVQLVIRFYGEVEEIHKNYDFAHCTCAWSSWDNELFLPEKALECIINKELYYIGSKYPLCSIVRTRKYLERGYHINAGQYVKMCFQLNELDLKDVKVLEDQLTGVDTTYFKMMVDAIQKHMEETGEERVDATYAMNLINKLF